MKIQLLMAGAAFASLLAASAQASTNFARTSEGASFVSGSSIIEAGAFGLTINDAVMQSNLLTDTPVPAISNGDTRYIFADNDPNATIEIDLGKVRDLTSIGAVVQTPSMGDRFVSSFAVETSTDGISFTPWGALSVDGSTVDPLSIAGLGDVRFIKYAFGPSGDFFGEGGSAVYQVEAIGVPEPATWAMMLVGFGGLGVAVRSRRKLATAAA